MKIDVRNTISIVTYIVIQIISPKVYTQIVKSGKKVQKLDIDIFQLTCYLQRLHDSEQCPISHFMMWVYLQI